MIPTDAYGPRRLEALFRPLLREESEPEPPCERVLQFVWAHQRLRRDALQTFDGQPLTVLHPGFWNREPGPDFRRAVLQFGPRPAVTGDVEIDLLPGGWHQHRHHLNPEYTGVRLRVVWHAPSGPDPGPPTLVLAACLDSPLSELVAGFSQDPTLAFSPAPAGACADFLQNLEPGALREWLLEAARVRLAVKARHVTARARQAGWTQALWEGLFTALGYKHNPWPMRRLAELIPALPGATPENRKSPQALQAAFLGLAGLLPRDLPRGSRKSSLYVRELWDLWWREQSHLADRVLPRHLWRLHGLRPANHPTRRLALAAHWLSEPRWTDRLEAWLAFDCPPARWPGSLLDCLNAHDPFWSRHWTLTSPELPEPHPLLGLPRATDLAMNVVLPWFWSWAQAVGNASAMAQIESR